MKTSDLLTCFIRRIIWCCILLFCKFTNVHHNFLNSFINLRYIMYIWYLHIPLSSKVVEVIIFKRWPMVCLNAEYTYTASTFYIVLDTISQYDLYKERMTFKLLKVWSLFALVYIRYFTGTTVKRLLVKLFPR